MKKTVQMVLFAALFVGSFALFLFLTFPYEVLKESLAAELSQATGYNIRIGDMSPSFPLGLEAENVKIEAPGGAAAMTIGSLDIGVNPFVLILGRIKATAEAKSGPGYLDVGLNFGIFDLIQGTLVPKRINFEAKAFPLDEPVQFALGLVSNAPGANPLVAPLLGAIGLSAQLNGKADLDLDVKTPTQSTGQAEINLGNALLKLDHPSLGLPNQKFAKALIKAKIDQGTLVVDKSSGLVSEELEILPEGKVTLKPDPAASLLDLKVLVKLNKSLKEKFGFLMDAVTGSASSEGQLTLQVRGSMGSPAVTTF